MSATTRYQMDVPDSDRIYFDLLIVAKSPDIEIWLGDDAGHLVQKETGELRTSLIPGDYVVEFGLGTASYPITLRDTTEYTQKELEAGPSCKRPVPKI